MSTEAADLAPGTAEASTGWRLDTANGSMVPRSALDVLVDLNDKIATGRVSEYQPIPLGFTPPDDNAHAPNESMDLTNYELGIRCVARLWDELAGTEGPDGTSVKGTR